MSWYYLQSLKTIGPVELSDLKERIELGHLNAMDLVSKDLGVWCFAFEHQELFHIFESKDFTIKDDRRWVLTKVSPEGGRKQLGPYRQDQVKKMIYMGEIKYSDLAWTEGMLQWYPLSLFEEFNKAEEAHYFKQEVLPTENRETPKPYLVYVPKLPQIEPPPPEADGESLV